MLDATSISLTIKDYELQIVDFAMILILFQLWPERSFMMRWCKWLSCLMWMEVDMVLIVICFDDGMPLVL